MKEGPLNVSVVDDNESVRKALTSLLEAHNHNVASYECAEDFLDTSHSVPCDLLITDNVMDGMSGIDLLIEIRKTSGLADLPVVVYSASDIRYVVERNGGIFVAKGGTDELLVALKRAENVARRRSA